MVLEKNSYTIYRHFSLADVMSAGAMIRLLEMVTQMKQPGLDDRHRDQNGEIRKKNSNTLVDTLRKEYGDDFAKGYRSDARLGTVLKKEGAKSLSELLKK